MTVPAYPATRAEPVRENLFGVEVRDPYRWLEDAKAPAVQKWMADEDELARAWLGKLPGRARLEKRLKELLYVEAISPPVRRGTRFFYSRTHKDKEKAITYWRDGEKGAEHVLIDPNTLSKDLTVSLGTWVPSWDGTKVAYALHANNSDEATLHVMDVATGRVSDVDVIEGGKYAQPSWTPSGDGFYYTWLPPVGGAVTVDARPGFAEVRFHKLGTDPKSDALVHEKTGNPQAFIGADLSKDGRWLFVTVQHGWNSTDVWFRDMSTKNDTKWRELAVGKPFLYNVEAHRGTFYVTTNDGAPRYRLFAVDPQHPARAEWREVVAEDREAVLEGVTMMNDRMALTWLRAAANEVEIRTLDGKPVRKVALPGIGVSAGVYANSDDDYGFVPFNSFTQPPVVLRTDAKTGATSTWAEVKMPIDAAPYTVEQVWYPSKDGTRVSMFVVHRKDLKKDGATPFLLYGYGGFNITMGPGFVASLYAWLEAGGGYAVANLRGGGEYGEDWHKAGMGLHKQNVFDDFAAAAQFLVAQGYTKSDRLGIRGGSNGGLLIGAAVTQHPELYRAAVCEVPLLDMVRFHKFGSGRTWIPEYGSADDEASFKALYAYSPYHHVRQDAHYPSVLMNSADADDRVDPMHARKFTAELQATPSAKRRPVILRIERHAGHGGADQVQKTVERMADTYAFLAHELGMKLPE